MCGGKKSGEWKRREWDGEGRRTDAGALDALGDLVAEGFREGDTALFEDGVEELGVEVSIAIKCG